ncbi:MAG: hypothetical protein ACK47B_18675 [Armatimonadota bacterium]
MAEERSPDATDWCAGLRLAEFRALTPAERIEIRYAAFARYLWSALAFVLFPLAFATFVVLGLPLASRPVASGLVAVVVVVGLVVMALLLLAGRDWLRWARALSRDARQGAVQRFEGVIPHLPAPDESLQSLLKEGLLQAGSEETQWLEVLPVSGGVLQANGVRPRRWIRARRRRVAEVPEYAATAAEWVSPARTSGEEVYLNHRELTAAETEELRRHIRRLTLRPLLLAVALDAWLGTVLVLSGGRLEGTQLLTGLLLLVVAVRANWSAYRSLALGGRLRQDLRIGRVVITRSPKSDPELETLPGGEAPTLSDPDEFLPVSGALWSEAGQPAPWRTLAH